MKKEKQQEKFRVCTMLFKVEKDYLRFLARKSGRSMSSYLRFLLREAIGNIGLDLISLGSGWMPILDHATSGKRQGSAGS